LSYLYLDPQAGQALPGVVVDDLSADVKSSCCHNPSSLFYSLLCRFQVMRCPELPAYRPYTAAKTPFLPLIRRNLKAQLSQFRLQQPDIVALNTSC
jgi:hypothetical protein